MLGRLKKYTETRLEELLNKTELAQKSPIGTNEVTFLQVVCVIV